MTSHLLATLLLCSLNQVEADADPKHALRLKFLRDTVSRVEFREKGDDPGKIELIAQPVLRWDNSRATVVDGATFLWVKNHRPQVIGCCWMTRKASHLEFQSLASKPLAATFDAKRFWSPAQAGMTWKPIPDAPVPAESRVQRLRQMKDLSQRFTTHAIKSPPAYDPNSLWKFRLLPTPIHRYAEKADVDGSIFAYVQGTDPELFLLLESREENGTAQWHYGFAAACIWELHGLLDDREVWVRPLAEVRAPDESYAVVENIPNDPDLVPPKPNKLD